MNRYLINVAQLLKEPTGSKRSYTLSQIADYCAPEELPRGKVTLVRTGRSILLKASLETRGQLVCSRCLAPFDHTLNLKIEEEYFPSINIVTGLPQPLPEDAGQAFTTDNNHILDLGEAMRQYELMAIPMKPLCRPNCAGLCPQCGRNLNQGPCGCSTPPDPRWAVLRELISAGKTTS